MFKQYVTVRADRHTGQWPVGRRTSFGRYILKLKVDHESCLSTAICWFIRLFIYLKDIRLIQWNLSAFLGPPVPQVLPFELTGVGEERLWTTQKSASGKQKISEKKGKKAFKSTQQNAHNFSITYVCPHKLYCSSSWCRAGGGGRISESGRRMRRETWHRESLRKRSD